MQLKLSLTHAHARTKGCAHCSAWMRTIVVVVVIVWLLRSGYVIPPELLQGLRVAV